MIQLDERCFYPSCFSRSYFCPSCLSQLFLSQLFVPVVSIAVVSVPVVSVLVVSVLIVCLVGMLTLLHCQAVLHSQLTQQTGSIPCFALKCDKQVGQNSCLG